MASALISLVDLLRTDTTSCGMVFRLLFLDHGLSRPCEYQHRDIRPDLIQRLPQFDSTFAPIGSHFALRDLPLSDVQVCAAPLMRVVFISLSFASFSSMILLSHLY